MINLALAVLVSPPAHPPAQHHPAPQNAAHHVTHEGVSPAAALQRLKDGNARFVHGHAEHPHQSSDHRRVVAGGQHPYAVIVTCADSRLSPEILFDEGLGDLFVVRVAGNVADRFALASVEYAVEHLGSRLVVVLGHSSCGAVKAAVDSLSVAHQHQAANQPSHGHAEESNIAALVAEIVPAVRAAKSQPGELLPNAIRTNVQYSIRHVIERSAPLRTSLMASEIEVAGGVYDLQSGVVEWTELRRGMHRVALYR